MAGAPIYVDFVARAMNLQETVTAIKREMTRLGRVRAAPMTGVRRAQALIQPAIEAARRFLSVQRSLSSEAKTFRGRAEKSFTELSARRVKMFQEVMSLLSRLEGAMRKGIVPYTEHGKVRLVIAEIDRLLGFFMRRFEKIRSMAAAGFEVKGLWDIKAMREEFSKIEKLMKQVILPPDILPNLQRAQKATFDFEQTLKTLSESTIKQTEAEAAMRAAMGQTVSKEMESASAVKMITDERKKLFSVIAESAQQIAGFTATEWGANSAMARAARIMADKIAKTRNLEEALKALSLMQRVVIQSYKFEWSGIQRTVKAQSERLKIISKLLPFEAKVIAERLRNVTAAQNLESAYRALSAATVQLNIAERRSLDVIRKKASNAQLLLQWTFGLSRSERRSIAEQLKLASTSKNLAEAYYSLQAAVKQLNSAQAESRRIFRRVAGDYKMLGQAFRDFGSKLFGVFRTFTLIDFGSIWKGIRPLGRLFGSFFRRIAVGAGRLAGPRLSSFGRILFRVGGKFALLAASSLQILASMFGTLSNAMRMPLRLFRTLWWTVFRVIYTFRFFGMMIARFLEEPLKGLLNIHRAIVLSGGSAREYSKMVALATSSVIRFGMPLNEVSSMLLEAAKAGFGASDAIKVFNAAMLLGAAWGGEYADAMKLVVGALRTYQLPASEATRVARMFYNAARRSVEGLHYMQTAWGYAGPAAEAFGFKLRDLLALMMVFRDAGIRASRAGMTIRAIFQGLERAAAAMEKRMTVSEAIRILGIDFRNLAREGVTLLDVWRAFRPLASRLQNVMVRQALAAIFGRRHTANLIKLIKESEGAIRRRIEAVQEDISLQKSAAKVAEAGALVWERIKNLWLVVRLNALAPLSDVFASFSDLLARLRPSLVSLGKAFSLVLRPIIILVENFLAALFSADNLRYAVKMLAMAGRALAKVVAGVVQQFAGGTGEINQMARALVNLVVKGVLFLVSVFKRLPEFIAIGVEAIKQFGKVLGSVTLNMDEFLNYLRSLIRLGTFLAQVTSFFIREGLPVLSKLMTAFTIVLEKLSYVLYAIVTPIEAIVYLIGKLGEWIGLWSERESFVWTKALSEFQTALKEAREELERFGELETRKGIAELTATAEKLAGKIDNVEAAMSENRILSAQALEALLDRIAKNETESAEEKRKIIERALAGE